MDRPDSAPRPAGTERVPAPLDGLLVADLSRVLAGPLASSVLADLGATVVKVERPGTGDDTRGWGPPWSPSGHAAYFDAANRTKRSVALDLDDPADLDLARELCRRADVLIENFRTGSLDRFGLDYDSVARANPGIVYCSITGFGSMSGAGRPGYDFVVQASGGLMSITGPPDGEPTKVGVALVDVLASKDATIGILAALRARAADGHGQRVEVNLFSSLLGSLANQVSGWLATGFAPGRLGNRHPSIAPYETLRCRDGYLAVACGNDAQFGRLARTVGAPDLVGDPRYRTNAGRVEHRDSLAERLEEALGSATAAQWEDRLVPAGVPCAQVRDLAGAFALAAELGLDPLQPVGGQHLPQVRHPVSFSRSALVPPAAPPRLGEHDADIRAWLRAAPEPSPQRRKARP